MKNSDKNLATELENKNKEKVLELWLTCRNSLHAVGMLIIRCQYKNKTIENHSLIASKGKNGGRPKVVPETERPPKKTQISFVIHQNEECNKKECPLSIFIHM